MRANVLVAAVAFVVTLALLAYAASQDQIYNDVWDSTNHALKLSVVAGS